MKLGIANRILVTDVDLEETVDITPRYHEAVALFEDGSPASDEFAHFWLEILNSNH